MHHNNLPAVSQPHGISLNVSQAINEGIEIKNLSPESIFESINASVTKAYRDTGFIKSVDDGLHGIMCNELTNYLIDTMGSLRVEEIQIAIRAGILGEYGDYMGISFVSCVKFLNEYKKSKQRREAFEIWQKNNDTVKTKPMLTNQFDTAKSNALASFEAHMAKQSHARAGAIVYDFLNSIGLITYSNAIKLEIYERATKCVIDEAEAQRQGADYFTRKTLAHLIERFSLQPEKGTKEYNLIIDKAKYITLCKYFDDIILSKTNFGELVESKREAFYNLKKPL